MSTAKLLSLRFLFVGGTFFVAFALLLFFFGPRSEASVWTRALVFAILIPPPVCFGAGIFFALSRESAISRTGAWANVAAIFGHGLAAISILQDFFA